MSDCGFWSGLAGDKKIAAKEGWHAIGGGNHRSEFPVGAWGTAKGRFRFTVDLETEQEGPRTWTLVLRHPEPLMNANARIATPRGVAMRTLCDRVHAAQPGPQLLPARARRRPRPHQVQFRPHRARPTHRFAGFT